MKKELLKNDSFTKIEDSMLIMENGIDLAGNSIDELSLDSCENFITFSPNVTITKN